MFQSIVSSVSSSISKGVAEVTTGITEAAAILDLSNAPSLAADNIGVMDIGFGPGKFSPDSAPSSASAPGAANSKDGSTIQAKPNVLTGAMSYVPLWTFAALTTEQVNNPDLYRGQPVSSTSVVFSSAGRFDELRISTQFGAPEYYINNVEITSLIGPNPKTQNAAAHTFKFEILEPYSMGLFLQSLQAAARNAGHLNYLDNCPYLLRLDYQGWTPDGKSFTVPDLTKYFTIRLVNTTFECNEAGSKYQVECTPFNSAAFGDVINKVYKDINIVGSTVKEALVTGEQSLVNVINDLFKKQKVGDNTVAVADEIQIVFPTPEGGNPPAPQPENNSKATMSPYGPAPVSPATSAAAPAPGDNAISGSDLGFTLNGGGNPTFMKPSEVMDANGNVNREQVRINPSSRTLMFTQGQAITDVITEVVMNSEYVRKSAEQLKKNPDGTVAWFKLDAQVKFGQFDVRRGVYAKIIIFRIVQFNVHSSIFQNPSTAPQGYKELEKLIRKKYQYIFTGQNEDVLRFNLKFNNTFYTAIGGSSPLLNKDNIDAGKNASASEKNPLQAGVVGTDPNASDAAGGVKTVQPALLDGFGNRLPNASNNNDERRVVAQDFHNAFINSDTDFIQVDLEILGDPYYLTDSGMGNYFAQAYDSSETVDGNMNFEGGSVYVHLSLKSVVDVDQSSGLYKFQTASGSGLTTNGSQATVSPFGGIYRLNKVENTFRDGQFTQRLALLRMSGQSIDFKIEPSRSGPTGTKEVIGEAPDTSTSDGDDYWM
jgi:hypothetical protein